MPDIRVFAPLGGGIGDVWFDWLRERVYAKIPPLVEDYGARIRIVTQCHCAGVEELFQHCPYVHEVVTEPWAPPTPQLQQRWHTPSPDGWIPLSRNDLLHEAGVRALNLKQPQIHVTADELAFIATLTSRQPCIVAQPYAGLSDRDGFDADAIARLAASLQVLDPNSNLIVIGKNHDRGHKYAPELCPDVPGVVNLIDKLSIRVAYHLVARSDAFVGAHSNLIRAAWDHRRRTALVVPDPLMTRHFEKLDRKYTYGLQHAECQVFTYPFDHGQERRFDLLDTDRIAHFLLRG